MGNPDGNLGLINTKLLQASVHASAIQKNATAHRAGAGTYEHAGQIIKILDEVSKVDLHELRKELEQQAEARLTHEGKALRPELRKEFEE